jgi:regulator of sirC expression with transglutaminase-like and TPR domain
LMERLLAAMRGDSGVDLDAAALELATFEYPELDPSPSLRMLDRIAAEIGKRADAGADGATFVREANAVLFDEMSFRGNEAEYYDPRNSCLNAVLERRTGIPITLSVVYMEVARRLGRTVHGIALPGHFIAQYDDGRYSTWLDPFRGGRLLVRADISAEPEALRPATRQVILVRMTNNLRAAYFRGERFDKVVETTDLLMQVYPAPDHHRIRGVANVRLRKLGEARKDLERYLEASPEAADRADVVKQLEAIHRRLATLN